VARDIVKPREERAKFKATNQPIPFSIFYFLFSVFPSGLQSAKMKVRVEHRWDLSPPAAAACAILTANIRGEKSAQVR